MDEAEANAGVTPKPGAERARRCMQDMGEEGLGLHSRLLGVLSGYLGVLSGSGCLGVKERV